MFSRDLLKIPFVRKLSVYLIIVRFFPLRNKHSSFSPTLEVVYKQYCNYNTEERQIGGSRHLVLNYNIRRFFSRRITPSRRCLFNFKFSLNLLKIPFLEKFTFICIIGPYLMITSFSERKVFVKLFCD